MLIYFSREFCELHNDISVHLRMCGMYTLFSAKDHTLHILFFILTF